MITHSTEIRVRYADTDQMGYMYYGNYATLYEVGRVEMLRSMGLTYKSFEENGVMMPVLKMEAKYIRPAYYDDLLTVKTTVNSMPETRIHFDFEVFNEKKELLNVGSATLVFVNMKTKKPVIAPEPFLSMLKERFSEV